MEEEDRPSASSPETDREMDQDELMEDAEDGNHENEDDNNDDEEEEEADHEAEADDAEADDAGDDSNIADADVTSPMSKSTTPASSNSPPRRPTVRPEALSARLYDIVPTMAAPQSTSINAMAITPDLRYWITGGSDGYIRKYDGLGTINGRLALTVAQKHPFVDSVTKAGILMSYWENEEPAAPNRADQDHILSPVYSLALHSDALWLLSGLESGGINLQSVRHDEGKKICCLQKHTNAVSVLSLAQDERSVLSGSWDKTILDWDLDTGQVKRSFDGCGGQISSIELRPASGDPVPAGADEPLPTGTLSTNNAAAVSNGVSSAESDGFDTPGPNGVAAARARDEQASPAHESLFGDSDAGSLFGETAGEQPFGQDDDGFATGMDMMSGQEGGMDHSADMAMAGMAMEKEPEGEVSAMTTTTPPPSQSAHTTLSASAAAGNVGQPPAAEDATDPSSSSERTASASRNAWLARSGPGGVDGKQLHGAASDVENDIADKPRSPGLATSQSVSPQCDPSEKSSSTFLSSAMDGTIRIWDRRVADPVARIGTRFGVPPWCMSACWSFDGNMIYAGRRNCIVEEFDIRKAKREWEPERVLRFPVGSGAVSALKPMVNGRHLVW